MGAWRKARRKLIEWIESTGEAGDKKPLELLKERSEIVFKEIDLDQSGHINYTELQQACIKMGLQLSEDEVKDMLNTADVNNDQTISLEEFEHLIQHEYDEYTKKTNQSSC